MSGSVVPRPAGAVATGSPEAALAGLQSFEVMILDRLGAAGLPTQGILVDLSQRDVLMRTGPFALTDLTPEKLSQSSYISKMIIAGSVGLFDAALNYLWDETVLELRKRVVNFDLQYFYEVAEKSDKRRQELKTEDDLPKLDDQKLLWLRSWKRGPDRRLFWAPGGVFLHDQCAGVRVPPWRRRRVSASMSINQPGPPVMSWPRRRASRARRAAPNDSSKARTSSKSRTPRCR
jgi:hypothetical protein